MSDMLTAAQVAERLGVHPNTVKRLLRAGRFPGAIRINPRGDVRIPVEDVARFVEDAAWQPQAKPARLVDR